MRSLIFATVLSAFAVAPAFAADGTPLPLEDDVRQLLIGNWGMANETGDTNLDDAQLKKALDDCGVSMFSPTVTKTIKPGGVPAGATFKGRLEFFAAEDGIGVAQFSFLAPAINKVQIMQAVTDHGVQLELTTEDDWDHGWVAPDGTRPIYGAGAVAVMTFGNRNYGVLILKVADVGIGTYVKCP